MSESRIREVEHQPLSAVSFVHDYVEFHFDGKIVRALSSPTVVRKQRSIRPDEAGWRDALCELIGLELQDLMFIHDDSPRLMLRFSADTHLEVPLAVDDRSGPEALNYVPGENEPIEVW